MKTTKRQAEILWEITNWLYPYEFNRFDKPDVIKTMLDSEIEEQLESLNIALNDLYDEPMDLASDKELIRLLNKLYKNIEKTKDANVEQHTEDYKELPF